MLIEVCNSILILFIFANILESEVLYKPRITMSRSLTGSVQLSSKSLRQPLFDNIIEHTSKSRHDAREHALLCTLILMVIDLIYFSI